MRRASRSTGSRSSATSWPTGGGAITSRPSSASSRPASCPGIRSPGGRGCAWASSPSSPATTGCSPSARRGRITPSRSSSWSPSRGPRRPWPRSRAGAGWWAGCGGSWTRIGAARWWGRDGPSWPASCSSRRRGRSRCAVGARSAPKRKAARHHASRLPRNIRSAAPCSGPTASRRRTPTLSGWLTQRMGSPMSPCPETTKPGVLPLSRSSPRRRPTRRDNSFWPPSATRPSTPLSPALRAFWWQSPLAWGCIRRSCGPRRPRPSCPSSSRPR